MIDSKSLTPSQQRGITNKHGRLQAAGLGFSSEEMASNREIIKKNNASLNIRMHLIVYHISHDVDALYLWIDFSNWNYIIHEVDFALLIEF